MCAFLCHIITIKYIGSSPGIDVFFSFCICCILTNTKLNCSYPSVFYSHVSEVILVALSTLQMRVAQIFLLLFHKFFLLAFWLKGSVFECDLDQACQTRIYFLGTLLVWLVDCQLLLSVHHLTGSSVLVDLRQLA